MYGLRLYNKDRYETPLSADDEDVTNPFRVTAPGLTGISLVKKVYLHNDNPLKYYTDITIRLVDDSGIYTTGDWSWKLISDKHEPVPEQWEEVTDYNTLSIDDIGDSDTADISSFIPVWIKYNIPAGLLAQNITSLRLRISAKEKLVA